MSKLDLTINRLNASQREAKNIPQGTYFTGVIDNYPDYAFLKGFDKIVSLSSGETWCSDIVVENYAECNAQIHLNPIL